MYQWKRQRLSADVHGTLGSYLRDAVQEGRADAVARLPIPRAFSSFLLFASWLMLLFLVRNLEKVPMALYLYIREFTCNALPRGQRVPVHQFDEFSGCIQEIHA
jgi:hypothetical protein